MVKKEADLYEPLKGWVKRKLKCAITKSNVGLEEARIDVIGLRFSQTEKWVNNAYSSLGFELIAFEVKKNITSFMTSAGQTAAYSVYSDRAYLCAIGKFEESHCEAAEALSIGLIEISESSGRMSFKERVKAPLTNPNPLKRREMIDGLGYLICSLCNGPFEKSPNQKSRNSQSIKFRSGAEFKDAFSLMDPNPWDPEFAPDWGVTFPLEHAEGYQWATAHSEGYLCPHCLQSLFVHNRAQDNWDYKQDKRIEELENRIKELEKKIKSFD